MPDQWYGYPRDRPGFDESDASRYPLTGEWEMREFSTSQQTGNGMTNTVNIDFDGCYNDNPAAWLAVANALGSFGINVVTVTSRRDTPENLKEMRDAGVCWPIHFAHAKPKKMAAQDVNWNVSVWIDDHPEGIGTGNENLDTQTVFEIELRHALDVLKTAMEATSGPHFLWHRNLIARLETVLGCDQ